jgi:hypothetical protein
MEGFLKIPNFQIPNIIMGCIKSVQNTQGAFKLYVLKGKSVVVTQNKPPKNFVMKSSGS